VAGVSPISQEIKDEISRLYKEGLSCLEIKKRIKTSSVSAIRNILQRAGVQLRCLSDSNRKFVFDEHYFDLIDHEHKAYWLGFICADGYIRNYGGTHVLSIKLARKDRNLLELLQRDLKSNHKIKATETLSKGGQILYADYLDICSKHLYNTLASYGLADQKTYSLCFPTCVPPDLIHHFIRGYFDGDGCITLGKYSPNLTIMSTRDFLTVLNIFLSTFIKTGRIRPYRKGTTTNVCNLTYTGNQRCINIGDYLYRDATIYLKRKKDTFEEVSTRWTTRTNKKLKLPLR
jgi:intein-encoded DNA endonuclease-like protein